jgi:hypothetical protein
VGLRDFMSRKLSGRFLFVGAKLLATEAIFLSEALKESVIKFFLKLFQKKLKTLILAESKMLRKKNTANKSSGHIA